MTIIIAADECRFQHLISDAGRASFDVFFQGFLGGESFPTRRHRCRRYSMTANHISGNDPWDLLARESGPRPRTG